MQRTILHADLDAFYASVEQLDNPRRGGGGAPPGARGFVPAASYEARRFGVRSAMPMSRALRLCPQAVRISPRFGRYAEVSRAVMSVFRAGTGKARRYGATEALALRLKRRVRERTGLTASIGAGANKTIAKIASDL